MSDSWSKLTFFAVRRTALAIAMYSILQTQSIGSSSKSSLYYEVIQIFQKLSFIKRKETWQWFTWELKKYVHDSYISLCGERGLLSLEELLNVVCKIELMQRCSLWMVLQCLSSAVVTQMLILLCLALNTNFTSSFFLCFTSLQQCSHREWSVY